MSARWQVELEPGVWLAKGEGDPPRTLHKKNARVFTGKARAQKAIEDAQKHRPFRSARIYDTQFEEFI